MSLAGRRGSETAAALLHPSGLGLQIRTPSDEIHRLGKKLEIWDILSSIARKQPNNLEGVNQMKRALRSVAKDYGIDHDHVPMASIWFNVQTAKAVSGAANIDELSAIEIPIMREMVRSGFRVVFVGGPLTSLGMEHKWDYWDTLFNRKVELAFRRPQQITYSITYYGKPLEERLAGAYESNTVAQKRFATHNRRQLTNGIKVFIATGAWRSSSGTVGEVQVAQRHGITVKFRDEDPILRELAVGAARDRGH